ncbi:MAG: hypothetical protein WCH11_05715 [Bdellovibrio sp.]
MIEAKADKLPPVKEQLLQCGGWLRKPAIATVEAETLDEVRECLEIHKKHPIYRILLDNMSDELMAQSLGLLPPEIESEASGNMSLERVPRVARLGVSCISVGALTHSAPSCDISLKFDWENRSGAEA